MDSEEFLMPTGPIPEHPAKEDTSLTSELTIISDDELASLKINVMLNAFGAEGMIPRGKAFSGAANLLGAFFELLGDQGKKTLAVEIKTFISDEKKIFRLAKHLVRAILLPFKAFGGKTPAPLSVASVYDDDATQEIEQAMGEIEPSTRSQARIKKDCLRRDGYRCIYTGHIDRASWREGLIGPPQQGRRCHTQCAHILPFALGSFDTTRAVETENKSIIWWTIYRYFPELVGKIGPDTINQPENLITLWDSVHSSFGAYELYFRPHNQIHTYESGVLDTDDIIAHPPGSEIIQLQQHDPAIPMPDPEYFRVHWIISQIYQVSGFGRRIDDLLERAELGDTNLQPDGSTDVGLLLAQKMLIWGLV